MKWVNFLHIYQPPSQTPEIIRRVTEESYRKIPEQIKSVAGGKMTINISGALTELLHQHGYDDVIASYRELLESGQIELTESACYHPFLPGLPESEMIRQIKLNQAINRKHFGEAYKPRGFYAPEMVYTPQIGRIVKDLGYEWMLIDEASFPGDLKPGNTIYTSSDTPGLKLFFRNRNHSFEILSAQVDKADEFKEKLGGLADEDVYLVTGMDGETFGHHRYGLEKLLGELLREFDSATISELIGFYPESKEIEAQQGTWALLSLDEARREPFSRWKDEHNEIHNLQWQLTDLAISVADHDGDETQSRQLLDKALHSDQYWWASAKPWWNIDMIGQGATELLDAVITSSSANTDQKQRGRDLFLEILRTAFHWRASGKVDELVKTFIDEEAHFRIKSGMRGQPVEKINALLGDLHRQLDAAVAAAEYNRASDFQRRIKELEAERDNLHGSEGKDGREEGDWGE